MFQQAQTPEVRIAASPFSLIEVCVAAKLVSLFEVHVAAKLVSIFEVHVAARPDALIKLPYQSTCVDPQPTNKVSYRQYATGKECSLKARSTRSAVHRYKLITKK